MDDVDRYRTLLTRIGVAYPRGILGEEARELARLAASGAARPDDLVQTAAALHWDALRGAMGAMLRRARANGDDDPAIADVITLTDDPSPDNAVSQALLENAVHGLAAVLTRGEERLRVLDQRLAGDDAGDEVARTVGDIVSDLLDLDVEDYEDEIAEYVRGGESDASRTALARTTGDIEMREWARSELAWVTEGSEATAGRALSAMARGPLPDDPAEDPVWLSTILALVEEAVEIVQVDEMRSSSGAVTADGDPWDVDDED